MNIAKIMTPWTFSAEMGNHPQLTDDHALFVCNDDTHQPAANLSPSPNLYVVHVECNDAQLAEIEADPTYLVLSSEVKA